jgi:hypothetical protein
MRCSSPRTTPSVTGRGDHVMSRRVTSLRLVIGHLASAGRGIYRTLRISERTLLKNGYCLLRREPCARLARHRRSSRESMEERAKRRQKESRKGRRGMSQDDQFTLH